MVGSGKNYEVWWFEYDQDGDFTGHKINTGYSIWNHKDIVAADINGDGAQDVLVASGAEINVLRATFTSSLSDTFRHYFLGTRRETSHSSYLVRFEQNRLRYDRENNISRAS